MRCGAFVRSPMATLAGLGTLAVMMTAFPLGAASAETQAVAAASSEADYYTRRARSVLEAERAALPQPHPLAASYPGKDVVVCEAGCPENRAPHVVFLRPEIPATVEASEAVMVPTSSSDGRALPVDEVACVAGCYGGLDRASAYTPPEPEPEPTPEVVPAASTGPWSPRVTPRDTIDAKLSPIR